MEHREETSPDQLLDTFRGRSLRSIIVFTVIVHAVVLLGASIPFLWRAAAGDRSKPSEEERVTLAVKEAPSSLRDIANAHGLRPQDLASRLDGSAPRAPRDKPAQEVAETPEGRPEGATTGAAAPPKSEIEKEIEKVEEGPTVPPVGEEEVDLFK